jgi:hypothetical protein
MVQENKWVAEVLILKSHVDLLKIYLESPFASYETLKEKHVKEGNVLFIFLQI